MAIKIGNNDIKDIKIGTKQIKAVYQGSKLIWFPSTTTVPSEPTNTAQS